MLMADGIILWFFVERLFQLFTPKQTTWIQLVSATHTLGYVGELR